MAKPKQRQLVAPPNKNLTSIGPGTERLGEEDGWVIVKKQIVKILIPPLPINKQPSHGDSGLTQQQARPRETISTQSDEREKSASLVPNKDIPTARRSPKRSLSKKKSPKRPPRLDHKVETENCHLVDNFRCRNALVGVHGSSRTSKQRPFNFLAPTGALLNQRMRASNLDRKLRRAGGLSHWLESLRLNQFIKIFRGKSVSKFQLVNLTMKKLKDMGANAVGPRRKLMHAMDCLCQPYCFETL